MRLEVYAEYTLGKKRVRGKVHKANRKTVIVETPDKRYIKRNIEKHNVKYLPHETY